VTSDLTSYRDSRALVFGASGFIGRNVAAALCEHGAHVVLAMRDPHASLRVLVDHLIAGDVRKVDLSQAGEAAKLVRAVQPDIVFNLAGYGVDREERDQTLARRLNTSLVREIVDAIEPNDRWRGQCLVHVGSALEFGEVGGDFSHPWHCAPTSLYGRTKFDGSLQLRDVAEQRRLRAVCARLFTVYGPGEHDGRLLPTLLANARTSGRILLSAGTQRRDFTYVGDVVEGLLRVGLVDHEYAPRALNIATGELHTVREFVERASDVLAIQRERLQFGALETRAEEMQHDPISIASLRALVGWTPTTSIEDGVRRTQAFGRR
jgi:nucleoside-diphosphate-sugar epimerase